MITRAKAVEIAVKCIQLEARKLLTYYLRYEAEPKVWPDWKNAHDKYQRMQEAIKLLEGDK